MVARKEQTTKKDSAVPRPSIVVVMGHIDHGKTTLLDTIRKSNIASREAGGITQHIGAYIVAHGDKRITFIDTPGHEAFVQMRLRGTVVADTAVLVVAADDGVRPQTKEALGAIAAAKIPYCVAINKIDKPNADPERAKNDLAADGVFLEGRGGTIPYAEISAKKNIGIDGLLEIILLLAELEELRYDPLALASGAVIESHRDPKRGVTAMLLVRNGVLYKNDLVVAGMSFAKGRILENFKGESADAIRASEPAVVVGFDELPEVGSEFVAFRDQKEALVYRAAALLHKSAQTSAETGSGQIQSEEERKRVVVSVIFKTDTEGSGEALVHETEKIQGDGFMINILRAASGDVSVDDITLAASAKNAVIIAFGVGYKQGARELAEKWNIAQTQCTIIYDVTDFLKKHIEELLPAEVKRTAVGKARVLKIFKEEEKKQIVGGKVLEGTAKKGLRFSLVRKDIVIGDGKTENIQQRTIAVSEVGAGEEFGALISASTLVAPGDILHFFEEETTKRILS